MPAKCNAFLNLLQESPVVAAVKNDEGLERALTSGCAAVFFLYGTILNIAPLVQRARDAGKLAFVHADLIEGLTVRDIAADFIAQTTCADGVISTRPNLIHRAKELELIAIQRFFLLDSLSFENVLRQSSHADVVDILPGTMPRVISRLAGQVSQPLIASGLLIDKQDVMAALSAGAMAVSTTCESLWFA
jgi:glycerol uptake operon antiterminator